MPRLKDVRYALSIAGLIIVLSVYVVSFFLPIARLSTLALFWLCFASLITSTYPLDRGEIWQFVKKHIPRRYIISYFGVFGLHVAVLFWIDTIEPPLQDYAAEGVFLRVFATMCLGYAVVMVRYRLLLRRGVISGPPKSVFQQLSPSQQKAHLDEVRDQIFPRRTQ